MYVYCTFIKINTCYDFVFANTRKIAQRKIRDTIGFDTMQERIEVEKEREKESGENETKI